MPQPARIELAVEQATADALSDERRRAAVGRLVDRMVRPGPDDPLAAVLEAAAEQARAGGLTIEDVEAELAIYNSEHRA